MLIELIVFGLVLIGLVVFGIVQIWLVGFRIVQVVLVQLGMRTYCGQIYHTLSIYLAALSY